MGWLLGSAVKRNASDDKLKTVQYADVIDEKAVLPDTPVIILIIRKPA